MTPQSSTLCVVGCGNLGKAILGGLINVCDSTKELPFDRFIACVRSEKSKTELQEQYPSVSIRTGEVEGAIREAQTVILAVDVNDVDPLLSRTSVLNSLSGKLMISVVAGRTCSSLETVIYGNQEAPRSEDERVRILRVLPNIAAVISESITAIEEDKNTKKQDLDLADAIFQRIGRTIRLPPSQMNAATAVGGSTPAMFAVICDAMIDAAHAVGMSRKDAQAMIYQAMKGTAEMLQSGVHPGMLKDQGTSAEGCTIGGLMVMEETGVRGHLGRALREAVTITRLMGSVDHVNDTRRA